MRTVPANSVVVWVWTLFITNATVPKNDTFLNTKTQPQLRVGFDEVLPQILFLKLRFHVEWTHENQAGVGGGN